MRAEGKLKFDFRKVRPGELLAASPSTGHVNLFGLNHHPLASAASSGRSQMESRYFGTRKRSASPDAGPSSSSKKQKTSTRDLEALLDCSQLLTQSAISSRFDEIADALLHDYDLVVCSDTSEACFRLLEFEFYLHKPGCHEDPFVHRTAEQGELGRW